MAGGRLVFCFCAAGSARSSCACPPCLGNTPRCAGSILAADARPHTRTGIPNPSAPHCAHPRQRISRNAGTASGIVATAPGSSTPTSAARSTEGPILPPRRSDTSLPRTENAPGSVLQRPEALAQDALARINSLVLRQRRFGVDVGQGLFFVQCYPITSIGPSLERETPSPLSAHWITFREHTRVNYRERHRPQKIF